MYEVKFDQELDQYIVKTRGMSKGREFVIVFDNEFDAKSFCAQLSLGLVSSPFQNPSAFQSIGIHSEDGVTIFKSK